VKRNLFWAFAALLLVYLLPLALPKQPPALAEAPAVSISPAPAETPAALPAAAETDEPRQLSLLRGGEVLCLGEEDYLVGVVAAEMPASFPEEALKAQAVAARSYARCCAASGKHPGADLCADPGCCQAWQDEEALREKWGEDYEDRLGRVRSAVEATRGQVLTYGGEPILAVFHSSSAGATEDCGAVWNPRPYLVSVSSPEGPADVPGYCSSLRCAPLDFRDVILSAHPEADFSGPEEDWIGECRRDASGRVESLVLGGVPLSGTELRRLFSLRSTAFSLDCAEGMFVFSVTGFGHGVGMSQYGAMVMAREGADYRQILAHYYPGTVLSSEDGDL
jgi:stage II sporulation protein D